jgi:hypothetical protein
MHHMSTIWHLGHMQRTSMGEARALFCRKLVEAQEVREKGGATQSKTIEVTHEESRQTFYTHHERFIQGLACLLNIHPSLKISP